HVLEGTAILTMDRRTGYDGPLTLDTRALDIRNVECAADGAGYSGCKWSLGDTDKILGTPLRVDVPAGAKRVRIHYATRPEASGLQWLSPAQTATKKNPFMFSQSQAIHARSWVPLQDSPAVRITYSATIHTPKHLVAVMSAENNPNAPRTGNYAFRMPHPIPTYLLAIAAGDIQFRAMGKRTGAYAEPVVVDQAAREFEDMERMLESAEELFGPYRWGRYDVLVLPPSFPFGGMENPRLTFLTPTLLAGDKSQVAVVAHELSHSWSGNLVTNATWRDFWLNEGFTTYLTLRVQEKVFGRDRADMEAVLEREELERELARLPDSDEILHINLDGRDPDDGMTTVPYVKGMLLLRRLEETFGRAQFDAFLRSWFQDFAFRSVTTQDFAAYLRSRLLASQPDKAAAINLEAWLTQPGLPSDAPKPAARAFQRVEEAARQWNEGTVSAAALPTRQWTTLEWLRFLNVVGPRLDAKRMAELDRAFRLTANRNSEITSEWLLWAIRNHYEPAYTRLEQFLMSVGRRKYLKPLYEELAKTSDGKQRGRAIYARARSGYHPIAVTTVDTILR
ncbi:MAG TPA: M1 family metallopeptidase, partial [Bryobacteraceae bacterium]|nr:M1 family metallopeptidase [Bryobacteraceae bacterium]